jgi:uncharacterized membrane protein
VRWGRETLVMASHPLLHQTLPPNVARPERVVSALGGLAVAGYGLHRRDASTPFFLLLGGFLVHRGLSGHCRVYDRCGLNTNRSFGEHGVPGNKGIRVEQSVDVNLPPAQVFSFWRNLENLPIFMPHLKSVERREDGISHWVVEGPAGTVLEWDAEIINERPGEMLAWQSLPGADVQNAGTVRFRRLKNGTRVTVVLQYQPPGGQIGALVASLCGESPDKQLKADLQRFREWVEAEPTILAE